MRPFHIAPPLTTLREAHPTALRLLDVAREGNQSARVALAQLWLTEGIPAAFAESPALYDVVRSWLGARLKIHAKEISLVGSARVGQSLNPRKLGKRFNATSDLDLLAVSPRLFESFRADFEQWSADYDGGRVRPRNPTQERYWADNRKRGPYLIRRGFMDSGMIPWLSSYVVTQTTAQHLWELVKKLESTDTAPKPKKASLRVYRGWEDAVAQIALNLKYASTEAETA